MGFFRRRLDVWLARSRSPVAEGLREGREVARLPKKERRLRNRAFAEKVERRVSGEPDADDSR